MPKAPTIADCGFAPDVVSKLTVYFEAYKTKTLTGLGVVVALDESVRTKYLYALLLAYVGAMPGEGAVTIEKKKVFELPDGVAVSRKELDGGATYMDLMKSGVRMGPDYMMIDILADADAALYATQLVGVGMRVIAGISGSSSENLKQTGLTPDLALIVGTDGTITVE